ncbi:MAG TPA: protein kinase, partial [Acidimicrobiia bacterium]|nr:protein kinase [Acidimicrobiia bacterium]
MSLDHEQVARALPGYDIGAEIGRGGWGVVLRAEHRQLGRAVAIKQLPRAFAADPGVRRRFVSEARLLATLDHPHIVPIYDYVEDEGLCLLVMELLAGGTLWDRLTTTGVSADSACGIVVAACSALHHAHANGILHRDIKPDNMLFAASGTVKVSDFGIAKVVGGTASMATRTGEVLGTPAYMAPEQALGAELTPGTDVYALGTVLYELLSGRLPFVDDGNAIALLYRHVHEQPTPLAEVAPDLPAALVEATMRALSTDPADRYETAEDFGVALADAASSALGPDWVQRGGVAVMATGRIGARISAPGHLADTEPRPLTPVVTSPAEPAPATVMEAAAPSDPTPGTELTSISPADLVPVQQVVADSPAAPGRKRRSPALVGLAVLVVAALVAGGVFVAGRGGAKHNPGVGAQHNPVPKPTVSATIP